MKMLSDAEYTALQAYETRYHVVNNGLATLEKALDAERKAHREVEARSKELLAGCKRRLSELQATSDSQVDTLTKTIVQRDDWRKTAEKAEAALEDIRFKLGMQSSATHEQVIAVIGASQAHINRQAAEIDRLGNIILDANKARVQA